MYGCCEHALAWQLGRLLDELEHGRYYVESKCFVPLTCLKYSARMVAGPLSRTPPWPELGRMIRVDLCGVQHPPAPPKPGTGKSAHMTTDPQAPVQFVPQTFPISTFSDSVFCGVRNFATSFISSEADHMLTLAP